MRTINRVIVGGFVFSNDGHMLLGRSRPGGVYPGFRLIPGGGVDEGETKEQAIRREIREEVGINLDEHPNATIELVNDKSTGISEKTLRDSGEKVVVNMEFNDFAIKIPKPSAEIPLTAGDDYADPEWVPVADLPNQRLIDQTKATIRLLGYL